MQVSACRVRGFYHPAAKARWPEARWPRGEVPLPRERGPRRFDGHPEPGAGRASAVPGPRASGRAGWPTRRASSAGAGRELAGSTLFVGSVISTHFGQLGWRSVSEGFRFPIFSLSLAQLFAAADAPTGRR